MLFNSYEFIILFLPITLVVFFAFGIRGYYRIAIAWLVGASLFYYGWWNPFYLGLILFSIVFNYVTGIVMDNRQLQKGDLFNKILNKKRVMIFGVSVNLCLLVYFKYSYFIVENIKILTGSTYNFGSIVLPLGISFFTFQQISYLVDIYKGERHENDFLSYCLFVTFFPQLIAGPIVHHREMMPQFLRNTLFRFDHEKLAVGMTIFVIGLFKKVVFADGIASYSTPVFNAAEQANVITFFEAWGGALAYTLQIYFDFSGYSDMAIGIARMFGIRLPLNFHSPYKAVNITEFWRRWHITLSRFLMDYLYIPLGGNRKGEIRRYVNLMITMFLGGIWHGAGWTFIIWGTLHGIYLVINHTWHSVCHSFGYDPSKSSYITRGISRFITFFAVVIAWVIFRAKSLDGAVAILQGMALLNGIVLDIRLAPYFEGFGLLSVFNSAIIFKGVGIGSFGSVKGAVWIVVLLIIAFFAPNTQQLLLKYKPAFEIYRGEISHWWLSRFQWRPSAVSGCILAMILIFALSKLSGVSEFLYYQF